MERETVILIRKQPTEYVVNYPYGDNGRNQQFVFPASKNNRFIEREVPMEVFNWLTQETTCIKNGNLVVKETEREEKVDVQYAIDNIQNYEEIVKSALSYEEIKAILEKGNHNALKKTLNTLVSDKSEDIQNRMKHDITTVAQEIGIDSVGKRKVLCQFLGLDFDMCEAIFNKEEN